MKNLFLALALMLLGFAASAQNADTLLSSYYEVKDALVKSNAQTASIAIDNLRKAVTAESDFKQKENLSQALAHLAKADGLDEQRAVFNDVSTILWQIVKSSDKVSQAVYYQYCPMKKAYWLSDQAEIKNPYFGSAMLTCGKVTESIK